ncbi:MAG: NADH-quinone oxidoreductase subunit K [Planctomycetes bacterium]|nr:NADH-quinone oxidoreductase subunit K [Planctomycetota bacterium]
MLALALALAVTCAAGAYLATSRDVLRAVIGLSLLGSAVNLVLLAAGRLGPSAPPILEEGRSAFGAVANPLPQALVLTAIVIGFALTCFALVLVLRLMQAARVDDTAQLRFAEPPAVDTVKPPEESDELAERTDGAAALRRRDEPC